MAATSVPRGRVVDWLGRGARVLLLALPVLFLLGRAPADVALSLIALAFMGRSVLERDWAWLATGWVRAALAIWAYLLVVSALADDPAAAYERALPFGRFVLFAAALQSWLLAEPRMRRAFLAVLAAVIAVAVLDTLVQFAFGRDLLGRVYEAKRLTGPFSGPVPGSFVSKTCFPVLGLLLAVTGPWPRRWRSLLVIGAIGVLGLTITASGERMALLTFGLGVVVLVVLLRELRRPLLVAMLAGVVVVGGAVVASPDVGKRLVGHTSYDLENFWEKRYGELIQRTFRIWSDQPAIGVGLKNFRRICVNDHFEARGPPRDRCYTHAHNVYLEWLVESGLIGFAGFLLLIGLWATAIGRGFGRTAPADRAIAAGAIAALVVFLWPLRTSMSFFSNWNAILFWSVLGLALAVCAPPRPPPSPTPLAPAEGKRARGRQLASNHAGPRGAVR